MKEIKKGRISSNDENKSIINLKKNNIHGI